MESSFPIPNKPNQTDLINQQNKIITSQSTVRKASNVNDASLTISDPRIIDLEKRESIYSSVAIFFTVGTVLAALSAVLVATYIPASVIIPIALGVLAGLLLIGAVVMAAKADSVRSDSAAYEAQRIADELQIQRLQRIRELDGQKKQLENINNDKETTHLKKTNF